MPQGWWEERSPRGQVRMGLIYGGTDKGAQIGELRKGPDVLVAPSPATHAILRQLKAGETVCHAHFVPKRVFLPLNTVFQIVCQTLFVPKTASETLVPPPLMKRVTGLGTSWAS